MSAKSDILNSTMEGASRSSPILNEDARFYILSNSKKSQKAVGKSNCFLCIILCLNLFPEFDIIANLN